MGGSAEDDNDEQAAEIRRLLEEDPSISEMYATREMHYGRIAWLAHHIRICNYQIHPRVARKLLSMIERTDPDCFFEVALIRRQDIAPAKKDPVLQLHRAADMALEVARLGGFKRAQLARAVKIVADRYGLEPSYVAKQVRPHKAMAVLAVEEEEMQALYDAGKVDHLGRPISPQTGFAGDQSDG